MTYTLSRFKAEFPDDDTCLAHVFRSRYGHLPDFSKYHRVRGRKCFAHSVTGHHIHPLAGTIFHKSSTSLVKWFEALYLFSQSRNGVSAKEIQRHVGVTYKTAWRMAAQVRKLMADRPRLRGTVEADEAYLGGRRANGQGGSGKAVVMGMVERKGSVRTSILKDGKQAGAMLKTIREAVEPRSMLYTDKYDVYRKTARFDYLHNASNHSKKQYRETGTIEGYWSYLKRSIDGTYHAVSAKHLQSYLDEFAFRYNRRNVSEPMFYHLLGKLAS